MPIHSLKCGSRNSPLALTQVREVQALLKDKGKDVVINQVSYATQGDKDKTSSLIANTAEDFFTDALDQAVLNREVDIAIHSAKDLPKTLKDGLTIFALTAALDETDCFVGKVPFDALEEGARIGTSSLIRQNAIKTLNPRVETVDIRGTIEERIRLVDDGKIDGVIVATVALKRLGLEHLIKEIMPWEAAPLQGQLAVVGRSGDLAAQSLFAAIDCRKEYGRVYLVGAGPGDPDLITVKGIKALKRADSVFYDFLINKDQLQYAPTAEKIYVGKRKGVHAISQADLSKQLRQKAQAGKNVVRLKGGDPLIFGRGAEEIEYLRNYHIDVRVIPGVSSATAIPANLGVPLTARGISSSVAFISGHGRGEKLSAARAVEIPDVETIVFLMGLTKLDVILESLGRAGWKKETPILVIAKGTCEDEKVIDGNLETIMEKVRREKPEQPALIIVGETVKFFDRKRYLQGRILYTGTNPDKFKPLGRIVHLPMIKIKQADIGDGQIQDMIGRLHEYHMVLLTSRFAVRYFFDILEHKKVDLKQLKEKDFVAIGKITARELARYDIAPALVANVETSQGMLEAIVNKFDVRDKKVLFPRSSLPNPYLSDELTKLGAQVRQVAVYENVKLPKRELPVDGIDKILFTSPSTVRNFLEDYKVIPDDWKILSKGPVTRKSLLDAGYESEVVIDD